jgi:hypothetical protein
MQVEVPRILGEINDRYTLNLDSYMQLTMLADGLRRYTSFRGCVRCVRPTYESRESKTRVSLCGP